MLQHRFALRVILAIGVVVILAFAGGVLAPAAHAGNGGTTIASAPELPIGATFVGGAAATTEFWRVTLAAGDTLTIDYKQLNNGHVDLYVYKPGTTDATLGSSSSVASAETYSQSQFNWTATGQGVWILKVYSSHGYQLTTSVARTSSTQAPAGTSIASAPELPIGATFVGGAVGTTEFWRVTLAAGDTLTVDYLQLNNGHVDLYVYKPDVTDYTLGSSSSVASAETYGQSTFTWTAIGQGSWILKIYSSHGYQLTTSVARTSSTQAAAGTSIASAPQLPVDTTVVGGAVGTTEFWRVPLAAGDKLTIDYLQLNDGHVDLYVYKPDVTDFTLGSTSSVASAETYGQSKFTWTATGQGSWILKVYSSHGYQLTAHVQHVIVTKLSPASGRRGAVVTITGRNFGAKRGTGYVMFGTVKCSKYTSWNSGRIQCKVPAKAKLGKVKVTVVTAAGTSNSRTFTAKP
jgi:hypothetical protein